MLWRKKNCSTYVVLFEQALMRAEYAIEPVEAQTAGPTKLKWD